MSESPRRVRVTAAARAPARPVARSEARIDEADAVFARALRRAQLRLALGVVAGFVIVMAALAVAIALIPAFAPDLDGILLLGVPLSWMLHAFAFYPVIVVFALVYQRGAARNERRYRQLRGTG